MNTRTNVVLSFCAAVLIAGLLGSILQTQINLAYLRDIGPPVSFTLRLSSTWHDLVHFAPIYIALIFATFLIAFPMSEFVAKIFPGHRMFWLVIGAATGLWLCFQLINHVAPMPTFIAATRGVGGTLLLLLAAAVSALIYTLMTPALNSPADDEDDLA